MGEGDLPRFLIHKEISVQNRLRFGVDPFQGLIHDFDIFLDSDKIGQVGNKCLGMFVAEILKKSVEN